MIKTLSQALRMDKERFKVPKSVQQAIPIQRIWPDGIFQQGTKFSKTYRFTDINYYIASKDNKTEMFLDYSELLNSLDSGISAKITINNRRINKEEFEKSILLPMKEDGLDHYREEYNEMLLSKITGTNNSIYQERYLTVSVHKRSIDDARTYFARIGTDIVTHLSMKTVRLPSMLTIKMTISYPRQTEMEIRQPTSMMNWTARSVRLLR